jgi:hypothetical protein
MKKSKYQKASILAMLILGAGVLLATNTERFNFFSSPQSVEVESMQTIEVDPVLIEPSQEEIEALEAQLQDLLNNN